MDSAILTSSFLYPAEKYGAATVFSYKYNATTGFPDAHRHGKKLNILYGDGRVSSKNCNPLTPYAESELDESKSGHVSIKWTAVAFDGVHSIAFSKTFQYEKHKDYCNEYLLSKSAVAGFVCFPP